MELSYSGPGVIKPCSCSTQLIMKFIVLMNVIMPTIVGILTFISMINTTSEKLTRESYFSSYQFLRSVEKTSDTLIVFLPIFQIVPKPSLCLRYHITGILLNKTFDK